MKRTSPHPITGWKAVALAPFVFPFALIAGLFGANKKTVSRTPEDVTGFIIRVKRTSSESKPSLIQAKEGIGWA